jgi:branched-chain amino acid transport system substrate-binding protein
MFLAAAKSHMRRWRSRLVAFASIASLTACTVSGPTLGTSDATGSLPSGEASAPAAAARAVPSAPGKAKVALLLPLSGPGNLATVARAMKQAGEMALLEQTAPGFELIVKDDRGTPDGARAAAQEALAEGTELLLGPLLSASVEAVSPIASAARVPVIAFSNNRRVASPGTWLLSFMPEQEVERIVGYAVAQGRRNFAALLPDDAYGRIVEEAFTRAVGAAQANVAAIERYGRDASSGLLEATRRLGEAINNPTMDGTAITADALLVPGEPDALMSIGPLLAYARIDTSRVKLLGTGGWDAPNIGRDVTFVGGWYPAPDQRGWQSFSEKFARTFGTSPPRIASIAFDAVGIALALSGAPAANRFTPAGLTRPSGFTGADGTVRFQQDGTAVRALAVYEVQSFGARVIDPVGNAAPAGVATSPSAPPAAAPSRAIAAPGNASQVN